MNKFSNTGMEVLAYKKELLNPDYNEIIKKALLLVTDQMQQGDVIDGDVHYALKDGDVDYESFKNLLLEKAGLVKTEEELYAEYEVVREAFDEKLRGRELFQVEKSMAPFYTESKVKEEQIHIMTQFKVDDSFISGYFGQAGDGLERLMRRKGFAERFIVLRYTTMMENFLVQQSGYNAEVGRVEVSENIELAAAPVYYNQDEGVYYAEFMMYIGIEELENEDNHEEILALAEDKMKEINDYVRIRTII